MHFYSFVVTEILFKLTAMWEFSQDSITEQLKVDQALLNVSSTLNKALWFYQLSDECVAVSAMKLLF